MKKNKGFTLIELLIVLAILGILAGIIIPLFTGGSNNAARTDGCNPQFQSCQR